MPLLCERPHPASPDIAYRRYPEQMTTPAEHQPAGGADDDLLAAAGIQPTEAGKQRFRDRLAAFHERWTPERWDALDAQAEQLSQHAA